MSSMAKNRGRRARRVFRDKFNAGAVRPEKPRTGTSAAIRGPYFVDDSGQVRPFFETGPPTKERLRECYTERACKLIAFAREEAQRLGHLELRNIHVLLGMLREGEGIGVTIINGLGVDLEELRPRVEAAAGGAELGAADSPPPPFAPSVPVLVESAIEQSLSLGHHYVGSEHFLLALANEASGDAAEVLASVGVTAQKARMELKRLFRE